MKNYPILLPLGNGKSIFSVSQTKCLGVISFFHCPHPTNHILLVKYMRNLITFLHPLPPPWSKLSSSPTSGYCSSHRTQPLEWSFQRMSQRASFLSLTRTMVLHSTWSKSQSPPRPAESSTIRPLLPPTSLPPSTTLHQQCQLRLCCFNTLIRSLNCLISLPGTFFLDTGTACLLLHFFQILLAQMRPSK